MLRYGPLLFLCLVLAWGSFACAPKRVGPTASSGYFFTILTIPTALRGETTALVVKVQEAQGRPVDGVPVEFEVDPTWAGNASVSPPRVVTQQGAQGGRHLFRRHGVVLGERGGGVSGVRGRPRRARGVALSAPN